jgi:LmbE family N-acetylglucosaminyl deacetylase
MTVADVSRQALGLPSRDLDAFVDRSGAVIVAPHPDDESLGCGGLIATARAAGRPVSVVFVTDGTGSHPNSRAYPPWRLRATREAEATMALRFLGVAARDITFLRLLDTRAPCDGILFDLTVARIANVVRRNGHASIFAPWRHDPHGDHLAAHLMAAEVARRLHLRHWSYPVWGWTLSDRRLLDELSRGNRLDIGGFLAAKRLAIAAHASQHGGVITDDPEGFQIPTDLLAIFEAPYEVFVDA